MVYKSKVSHPLTNVVISAKECSGEIVLTGIELSGSGTDHTDGTGTHKTVEIYGKMICRFLDGKSQDLSSIPLDFENLSNFSKKVLQAARLIKSGETVSYEQLSSMAGYPGATRAAASVMRKNRYPLVIPCHRVIRKDGSVGGYCGIQQGAAVELKKKLLEMERQTAAHKRFR